MFSFLKTMRMTMRMKTTNIRRTMKRTRRRTLTKWRTKREQPQAWQAEVTPTTITKPLQLLTSLSYPTPLTTTLPHCSSINLLSHPT